MEGGRGQGRRGEQSSSRAHGTEAESWSGSNVGSEACGHCMTVSTPPPNSIPTSRRKRGEQERKDGEKKGLPRSSGQHMEPRPGLGHRQAPTRGELRRAGGTPTFPTSTSALPLLKEAWGDLGKEVHVHPRS